MIVGDSTRPSTVPLVLVESLTAIREASASSQDHRPEIRHVKAHFFEKLSAGGLLG